MKANAVPVLAIFESKARHEVPLFQRQYVWNRDHQWEPLWEDIRRKFEEFLAGRKDGPVHFLGAMVFDQKQTPTGHVDKRQVIDGQQRLTTLQIFIAALRDVCAKNAVTELADECDGYLFNKGMKSEPDDRFKVWPTQLDRSQFKDVLEARSRVELELRHPLTRRPYSRRYDPRPRMVEAYIFFYAALTDFLGAFDEEPNTPTLALSERLEECFNALRGALQVVIVDLDREDDAQVIFETLNARGEPLLPADLLRNYIFLRAARLREDQEGLYQQYWARFDESYWRELVTQGRLTRPRSDLFLQHFLASQITADIPIKHLFVEYKHWIEHERPFSSVAYELEELAKYGDAFRRLSTPIEGDQVYRVGSFLLAYDTSTAYPLLLQLLTMDLTDTDLRLATRMIESYVVRRTVCGFTNKAYNRIFLNATRAIKHSAKPTADLGKYFSGLSGESVEWPSDESFRNAWYSEPLYQEIPTPRIVYVLKCLSAAAINLRSEEIKITSAMTVEHIMPQNWIEHWPLKDGARGLSEPELWNAPVDDPLRQATERRNKSIHTIGNLTLLTQNLNSEVQNEAWLKKKPRLLEVSLLPINQRLHAYNEWTDDAIVQRSEELFELAKEVWPPAHAFEAT